MEIKNWYLFTNPYLAARCLVVTVSYWMGVWSPGHGNVKLPSLTFSSALG